MNSIFVITVLQFGILLTGSFGHNQEIPSTKYVPKIKELIARLENSDSHECRQISLELSEFKGVARPYLVEGLKSPHSSVRKGCCYALSNIVGGHREYSGRHIVAEASEPLLAATTIEKNDEVLWYMVQAIDYVRPDAKKAIPVLVDLAERGDDEFKKTLIEVIGNYESDAISARPMLHEIYKNTKGKILRTEIHFALTKIGVDIDDIKMISSSHLTGARDIATALNLLLDFPDHAISFLERHPGAMSNQDYFFRIKLSKIFEEKSAATLALRQFLANRKDLPSILRVEIGTAEQLALLRTRLNKLDDDPHQQSFVRACIRAIEVDTSFPSTTLSKNSPGDFRPVSAHPNTDKRRMTELPGHLDGFTEVLITGTIELPDGTPAENPKFFAVNDRMLLGQKHRVETPLLKYDNTTGRFAYVTNVFAAYGIGNGQEQPGPYQTGTAKTLIEAENGERLIVDFYDEMPHVKIILSPR